VETESGSWGSPLVMCEEGLGASTFWASPALLAVKSARWYPCRHGEGCDEGCVWKPSPALGALCNLTAN